MTARTSAGASKARSKKAAKGESPALTIERPKVAGVPALDELLDQGKEQGYLLEEDLESLFDDANEVPEEHVVAQVRQAILDYGIEIVQDEVELQQATDDAQA